MRIIDTVNHLQVAIDASGCVVIVDTRTDWRRTITDTKRLADALTRAREEQPW